MRWIGAAIGAGLWVALGCGGGSGPVESPPTETTPRAAERQDEVGQAMSGLGGTRLDPQGPAPLASMEFGVAGHFDVGRGLQVLQASPTGQRRRAVQASVVFDRPIVPLGDLDSMGESAPLSCAPDTGAHARWAGTATVVLVPDGGAFPDATAFTCTVAAGLRAIDGTVLEKPLTFTFETPRLQVLQTSPGEGASQVDPKDPIEVVFDQPVDPRVVASLLELRADGAQVPLRSVKAGDQPTRVVVEAALTPDTGYALTLKAGATSLAGPLPTTTDWTLAFRTYPAFSVVETTPSEAATISANAWLEMRFSTEVTRGQVDQNLRIEPKPPIWDPGGDDDWPSTWWSYGVALAPRTAYTVTLAAGTRDVHGQELGHDAVWTFTTADFDPAANLPTGFKVYPANNPPSLPYKHLNVSALDLRGARFSPDRLGSPQTWDDSVARVLADAPRAAVDLDPTANRTELDSWDFRSLLDADGKGWIATRFVSPDLLDYDAHPREFSGLWVVTDLGGTVKIGPRTTEVWVTSLSTGEPVPGVEVVIHDGRIVGRSSTDGDGLARLDVALPASGWDRRDVWVELKKGTDDSVVVGQWGPDGWAWLEEGGQETRAVGWTDRGVYRLGDPVHAYALFRRAAADGLSVHQGAVQWKLVDPDEVVVAQGDAPLDAHGAFAVDTELPRDGRLGDYTLVANGSGSGWASSAYLAVPARAYRPPAFRVSVSAPAEAVAGDPVSAAVDARYLFGAALRRGEVDWEAWTSPASFSPEGWKGWAFGPEPPNWWEEPEATSETLPGAEGPLSEQGTWSVTLPPDPARGSRRLSISAAVTDVDRQEIANHAEVVVHPGDLYAGLRSKTLLPSAGEATPIEVAVVGLDGAARSGVPVTLTLVRRTTDSVREKGMDGHWRWVNTTTDTDVATTTLTSATSPVTWSVTPADTGRHVVIASVTDTEGREARTETTLWVLGKGVTSWARRDDGKMALVLDRATVAPGETARVLIQAPLPDLWVWVTAEREGVLWRDVVKLEGNSGAIDVPTVEAWLPGVRITALAVTGAGPQDAPDKGRPEAFVGETELVVDSSREHLTVQVATSATVYRPRDPVDVEVQVLRDGAPAGGAGVLLYAVDESILSLTDYRTPDPFDEMYRAHTHSVATSDARWAVLDRAPYLTKGAKIGGGGDDIGEGGPEVRSRFVTTIAWRPDLVTGPDGKVKASFVLPDNLTAFRVMAVASESGTAFGSGEREIRVTRPLVVRPALPRLLREGDEAFAGVVVTNDTDEQRWVEVGATVRGPIELTGAPFGLDVPARTSMEVPFHLRALEAGPAVFTFRADSGDDHDGVEIPLEVGRDVVLETTATAGLADGTWTEQIARPDGARPGFGDLRIDLASTALVGTTDGLSYLLDYPYGCIEQKSARALGALAVLSVYDRSGTTLPRDGLESTVQGVLGELSLFRSPYQGGFAYWKGGSDPSVLGTVYAVELLARARQQGFSVSDRQLAVGVDFLRSVATEPQMWFRSYTSQERLAVEANIAWALALAGASDAGLTNRVWDGRASLPVFALARLQETIALAEGAGPRTEEIGRIVASRTTIDAASASVKETESERWARMWASDDLATAAALEGLVAAGGGPLAPKYALHLAESRKTGHWHDTRATATALFALARYADRYETHGDAVKVALRLAGTELLSEELPVPGTLRREVPLADVPNGPLVVTSDDPVYWFARLRYAPQNPKPRDEGLGVQRRLEILEGGGSAGEVVAGATLRVTLTVITPTARHFVAVRDPIPAGFEAVDSSLATVAPFPGEGSAEGYGDSYDEEIEEVRAELPDFGGSWAFDHSEIDDGEVRLFSTYLPPGVHTFRYVVRATTPGTFHHPPMRAEEMYEPEVFGQTGGGTLVIGERQVASR